MKYWLMKTEGLEYGIDEMIEDGVEGWDGVRNYQARNFMRDQMKVGDLFFIYHSCSGKQTGIHGVGRIVSEAYDDPTQFDPKDKHFDPKSKKDKPTWQHVDVSVVHKWKDPVLLPTLKLHKEGKLASAALFRQSRLSIQPVTKMEWDFIHSLRVSDENVWTESVSNKKQRKH